MSHNLLKGKKGIIFGALNDMSIAWKVAERCVEEGATVSLSNTPFCYPHGQYGRVGRKAQCEADSRCTKLKSWSKFLMNPCKPWEAK